MNKNLRKAVIAGNWKMNKTPAEAKTLIEEAKPLLEGADCDVIMCVPFVDLCTALEATKGTNIKIGAQNCHFEKSGAFTGEISAPMLKEMGVEYVILGHSERRTYFGDTDETVAKRLKALSKTVLRESSASANIRNSASRALPPSLWQCRSKSLLAVFRPSRSKMSLSHMSPFGQSEQVSPPPPSRQTRFAELSAPPSPLFIGKEIADGMTVQYGGSMTPKMPPSCSPRKMSTADLSAELS